MESGAGRIQSVERAARILLAFAAPQEQLTVAQLARMLDVHKSTASRLVATLVSFGLLARSSDDALCLGPELARLGALASAAPSLEDVARPAMEEVTAQTGEGVTLAVVHGGEAMTIAQSDGRFVIGAQGWVGRRSPLHATSDGKALLAFGAAEAPEGELEALTDLTLTDRSALGAELDATRERGWARSAGEFEPGLHGIAAPVFDAAGLCIAALCLSGPSYRIGEDDLPRLAAVVRRAADRVTATLTFRSPAS
ncbi:MAG: IclR family transcriptional regulator [Solirubrobacteraceae bacterium]|nr:IclR family transcriptional regulator [Solirubrobacteraceae bacterium]